jgi:MarR family transcriptional regulator, organic hydroperoxide resistance regulator
MAWCPDGNQLDQEIFDAMAGLLSQLLERGEELADQLGLPVFCLKALHRLGGPVTMSELGKQMHCDRSFVTMIADTLEERGLARREPNPDDRRLKNLVLTPEGLELKRRLECTLLAQMPWSRALDVSERECLLGLVQKMSAATASAPPLSVGDLVKEVTATENAASPAAT